jgi:hypothetical protein
MRYSIGILIAVAVIVFGVGFLVWRYEGQLNEARVEAEQLKADGDKMKADRDMAKAIVADITFHQADFLTKAQNLAYGRERMEGEIRRAPAARVADSLADFLGKAREGDLWPRPAMVRVPELEGLADSLGFQRIYVFRWHGGTLDGWIQFQTEAEPVKRDFLDYAKMAKVMGGENYDPRGVSGVIAIAFKARKDEPDISDCVVAISQRVQQLDKNGLPTGGFMGGGSDFSGAIDARKAGISSPPGSANTGPYIVEGGNFALYFHDFHDVKGLNIRLDKKFQVFELKLSPDRGK